MKENKAGIIYVTSTVVSGLIKIGKTKNFEERMSYLERHGYRNVGGLKREFAIKVNDYEEKEKLIHNIFSKSQVGDTELFALDIDIVKSLLASLEGKEIYPKDRSKEEIFEESTDKIGFKFLLDGKYELKRKVEGIDVHGIAIVKKGEFTLQKGSVCRIETDSNAPSIRKDAKISDNGILLENLTCNSPSGAGWVILGKSNNGWNEWKDENGKPLSEYRK